MRLPDAQAPHAVVAYRYSYHGSEQAYAESVVAATPAIPNPRAAPICDKRFKKPRREVFLGVLDEDM